jgi:hypothetical protein
MKVERKLSDFSVEKRNENMERKWNFFGGSGNGNEIACSGGTDAEKEVSVSN